MLAPPAGYRSRSSHPSAFYLVPLLSYTSLVGLSVFLSRRSVHSPRFTVSCVHTCKAQTAVPVRVSNLEKASQDSEFRIRSSFLLSTFFSFHACLVARLCIFINQFTLILIANTLCHAASPAYELHAARSLSRMHYPRTIHHIDAGCERGDLLPASSDASFANVTFLLRVRVLTGRHCVEAFEPSASGARWVAKHRFIRPVVYM
jgi:hypothetical protein